MKCSNWKNVVTSLLAAITLVGCDQGGNTNDWAIRRNNQGLLGAGNNPAAGQQAPPTRRRETLADNGGDGGTTRRQRRGSAEEAKKADSDKGGKAAALPKNEDWPFVSDTTLERAEKKLKGKGDDTDGDGIPDEVEESDDVLTDPDNANGAWVLGLELDNNVPIENLLQLRNAEGEQAGSDQEIIDTLKGLVNKAMGLEVTDSVVAEKIKEARVKLMTMEPNMIPNKFKPHLQALKGAFRTDRQYTLGFIKGGLSQEVGWKGIRWGTGRAADKNYLVISQFIYHPVGSRPIYALLGNRLSSGEFIKMKSENQEKLKERLEIKDGAAFFMNGLMRLNNVKRGWFKTFLEEDFRLLEWLVRDQTEKTAQNEPEELNSAAIATTIFWSEGKNGIGQLVVNRDVTGIKAKNLKGDDDDLGYEPIRQTDIYAFPGGKGLDIGMEDWKTHGIIPIPYDIGTTILKIDQNNDGEPDREARKKTKQRVIEVDEVDEDDEAAAKAKAALEALSDRAKAPGASVDSAVKIVEVYDLLKILENHPATRHLFDDSVQQSKLDQINKKLVEIRNAMDSVTKAKGNVNATQGTLETEAARTALDGLIGQACDQYRTKKEEINAILASMTGNFEVTVKRQDRGDATIDLRKEINVSTNAITIAECETPAAAPSK